jgi:hypothetical protein
MRTFHYIIAIFGSAVIMGCGTSGKPAQSPADQADYNWADYKGTYAPGSPATKGQAEEKPSETKPSVDAKSEAKTDKTASSDIKSMSVEDDAKPPEDDAAPPKKKKKKKKGGVASGKREGGASPSTGTPKRAPRKRAKR